MAKGSKKAAMDFEKSLADLEALVARMESGEQSLEDALKDFETGIALTRQCQEALKNAELKVQKLLRNNGEESLVDFEEQ